MMLDAEILKSYRPVSNLSFLSKLTERIVYVQLVNHLDKNGLYKVFQSTYRQLHSTETELLRVQNDIHQVVDSRGGDQSISPSDDPPRNFGVIFDSTCCLAARVAKLCRSINFNLHSVGKIWKCLDGPTAEKIINATATSRLEYCNSL